MSEFQDDSEVNTKRYGWPVDPYRLFLFYKNKWHWLLIGLTVGLLIGAIIAKTLIPRDYRSMAALVLNPEYTDLSYHLDAQSTVDSILLPSNIEEVIKRLKLRVRARDFVDHLSIDFDFRRSSSLRITVSWPSIDEVVKIANTVADVFIDHQKRQIGLLHQETIQNLQMDLDIASARLANVRQVYDTLRKEKGFADINLETEMAIQEAARLRFEADQLAAETSRFGGAPSITIPSEQRESTVSRNRSAGTSEEAEAIRSELSQARARLEAARTRLPPEHPTIKALEFEVEKLEAQLPLARRGRGSSNVRQTSAGSLNQRQALEDSAARAEARVKELAQDSGEVTTLLMDINVAERHVEDLKLRLAGASDEARNPPLMFRLLAAATPISVVTKSIRKYVVIGFGLGSFIITVLGLSFSAVRGLRIYTASEAAYWSKMPVVGSSMWPSNPNMLQVLIRDFDDYAPTSTGSTLIVSISNDETERYRAQVVAQWLNQSNALAREAMLHLKTRPPALKADNLETDESFAIEKVRGEGEEQTALDKPASITRAWTGPIPGPLLRRAARLADRVIVTLTSGTVSAFKLTNLTSMLGRKDGIGLLLLGLDKTLANSADRIGPVKQFWSTIRNPDR